MSDRSQATLFSPIRTLAGRLPSSSRRSQCVRDTIARPSLTICFHVMNIASSKRGEAGQPRLRFHLGGDEGSGDGEGVQEGLCLLCWRSGLSCSLI